MNNRKNEQKNAPSAKDQTNFGRETDKEKDTRSKNFSDASEKGKNSFSN